MSNDLSVVLTPVSGDFPDYNTSLPVSSSFTSISAISAINYDLNGTITYVLSSVNELTEVNPFTQFALQFFDYPGTCTFSMTAFGVSGTNTFTGYASAFYDWSTSEKEREGTRKYILGMGRGNKGKTT